MLQYNTTKLVVSMVNSNYLRYTITLMVWTRFLSHRKHHIKELYNMYNGMNIN